MNLTSTSIGRLASALGLTLLLAGCQTASVDDLAPSALAASSDGPVNTGEYPNFGRMPQGETAQLGPDGTAALKAQLNAARASQNVGGTAPETYAERMRRLRRLGQLHGTQTLQAIEAAQ